MITHGRNSAIDGGGEITVTRSGELIEIIVRPEDRGATTVRLDPAMARRLAEAIIRRLAR